MDWFLSLVRVVGVNFPVSAAFVQIQAELDASNITQRLTSIEDPISALHPLVLELSLELFEMYLAESFMELHFANDFYEKYARPLAALQNFGSLELTHQLGGYPSMLTITDPSYILYCAAIHKSDYPIRKVLSEIDGCKLHTRLNGIKLAKDFCIPLCLVRSILQMYDDLGYGSLSWSLDHCDYFCLA